MATDSRILPLASLRLYEPGQGDPIVTDHGFGWYDVLRESAYLGTSQLDANGERLVEYVQGVGLCLRPFLKLADTRLARWDTSGGTWEERHPATGSPRKYRLNQLDTTADLQYSATSDHNIPANPHVAFSVVFMDTPPDHDADTLPPYFRIELGHNSQQWALEFSKIEGARLLGYNDITSAWEVVGSLPEPERLGNADNEECVVLFRVLRDQLAISTDRGKNYAFHPLPRTAAGVALPVRTGPVVVRGQGGFLSFGMHPLKYFSGHYTSPPRNTLTSRSLLASPTITGRYSLPTGTALAFSDQSSPVASTAKWRATMTPASHATSSFTFYSTPELYAVQFTYPIVREMPWGNYTTPWDGAHGSPVGVTHIGISKPYELAGASASVAIRLDPSVQFSANLRWRKVTLLLGELDSDGSTARTVGSFTGYIKRVTVATNEYNSQSLKLELVTLATRLQRAQWSDFDRIPLGGRTLNAALDVVLESEGLADFPALFGFPYSYRSWHAIGDYLTLDSGTPENPLEWPKHGESKWETLTRIAGYAGLEIAVLDDGTLSSGPQKYVSPYVNHVLKMVPDEGTTDGLKRAVKSISYVVDYCESVTAVLVQGEDIFGAAAYAYAVDLFAEQFAASPRFSPWRELYQEEVPCTVDPGGIVLATRVQALALEGFPLKCEPDVTIPVNLDVGRRARVRIEGAKVGIDDWDEFAVLTLEHNYRADDPGFARMETTAGLRRVYP